MKDKKLITEYFDGVKRNGKTIKSFSMNLPLIKSGLKLSLATIFSFLLLLSVSSVGGTVSYYNDTEGVFNNYFRADPISFKVETATDQIDLSQDKRIDLVMTPDEISDPIQYFVASKIIAGDGEFCSGINVTGTLPFSVSSRIDSLNTDISTTTGIWTLTASVADGLKSPGMSCQVELTYLGWNAGSILGKSFTDTRKINLLFFIPSTYKINIPVDTPAVVEVISDVEAVTEDTQSSDAETPSTTEATSTDENAVPEPTPTPSPVPTVTPTPEVTVTPEPDTTPVPTQVSSEIPEPTPSQS